MALERLGSDKSAGARGHAEGCEDNAGDEIGVRSRRKWEQGCGQGLGSRQRESKESVTKESRN